MRYPITQVRQDAIMEMSEEATSGDPDQARARARTLARTRARTLARTLA